MMYTVRTVVVCSLIYLCIVLCGCVSEKSKTIDCEPLLHSVQYVPEQGDHAETYAMTSLPWGSDKETICDILGIKESDLEEVSVYTEPNAGMTFCTKVLNMINPDGKFRLYVDCNEEGSQQYAFYFYLETEEMAKEFCSKLIADIDERIPETISRASRSGMEDLYRQWNGLSAPGSSPMEFSRLIVEYYGDGREFFVGSVGAVEEACYLVFLNISSAE